MAVTRTPCYRYYFARFLYSRLNKTCVMTDGGHGSFSLKNKAPFSPTTALATLKLLGLSSSKKTVSDGANLKKNHVATTFPLCYGSCSEKILLEI